MSRDEAKTASERQAKQLAEQLEPLVSLAVEMWKKAPTKTRAAVVGGVIGAALVYLHEKSRRRELHTENQKLQRDLKRALGRRDTRQSQPDETNLHTMRLMQVPPTDDQDDSIVTALSGGALPFDYL